MGSAPVSTPSRKEQQRLNQSRTSQQTATERLGVQLNSVLTEPLSDQGYTLPMWLWWLLGIFGPLTLVYTEFKRLLTRFTARNASGRAQVKAGRVALSRLSGLDGASLDYAVLDDVMMSYLETRLQLTLRHATHAWSAREAQKEKSAKALATANRDPSNERWCDVALEGCCRPVKGNYHRPRRET